MNILATPLLLCLLFLAADKPTPKLPLGKDTTYITEPLDKDGYLDYAAALNDRLGKGITPEKNANVLIWKAIGPRPDGGDGMPAEFFKRLGMEEPPEKGDYLIDFGTYMKVDPKRNFQEFQATYDQHEEAMRRPWSATEYPQLAAWLKVNEKPLALFINATKRPDYFNPLVRGTGRGMLVTGPFPSVQRCRTAASTLAIRAMLRASEGKLDEAWQDLLACQRLGGLIARGGTTIEFLIGNAVIRLAMNVQLRYLELPGLTTKQLRDRLKDLDSLLPLPTLADKIDLAERFQFLDDTQTTRRDAVAGIDWESMLRNGNKWYDRIAAASRLKARTDRQTELDAIEVELKAMKRNPAPTDSAHILIGIYMPAVRRVQNRYDELEQLHRNLRLAFALAAYHADNNRYPAKLDDLAPKYLPSVPDDLFSSKPLIYRVTDKGYLLYSVGVNGKDEDGRSFDDDPAGDDLPVRMPLPERKAKK